ncbi:glycosyltransferase [Paenibacillus sp. KS-LC4]|uniref:glycosyltransferase n=1 Tax=Paenibacillus sp. KS-LC4 TaxID=2979727 RepID=UPI0030D3EC90
MFNKKKHVLIASPVQQQPTILALFLASLKRLHANQLELSYLFIDDNTDATSSLLLSQFAAARDGVTIISPESSDSQEEYVRTDMTHCWNERLIWKVADFKNRIIDHALHNQADYLFLLDSDLLLDARTLEQLVADDKDIVSEIFWTRWQPEARPQPQVWLHDEYGQWEQGRGEKLSDVEIAVRLEHFFAKISEPGVYEVGGLGACTLLSRRALKAGVHFGPISNLTFWGEDRHFCIRAAALGLKLFVDTHYPAYHIYRSADLAGAERFLQKEPEVQPNPNPSPSQKPIPKGRLTLSMVVRNESSRYLRQALEQHRQYIDDAVIIDDGSTDDTADVCLQALEGIPVKLIRNEFSRFSNEVALRQQQWEETLTVNPEWILNLDADEWFEQSFAQELDTLLRSRTTNVFCFRLYDFWSLHSYRSDAIWRAHESYRPFLLRYDPTFNYKWKNTPQHCGRFPANILELPHQLSEIRLKHYGWAKVEHRREKLHRYQMLDPDAKYGWKEQYLSILDDNPQLVEWQE